MSAFLNARDKLSEISARLTALQALFDCSGKHDQFRQFNSHACWGIDRTIQTLIDDLKEVDRQFSGDPPGEEVGDE